MRYAHMVRQQQSNLPVPPMASTSRKLRPISKRANTIALDMRNSLAKARTSGLAFLLLASPFLIAIFMIISASSSSSGLDGTEMDGVVPSSRTTRKMRLHHVHMNGTNMGRAYNSLVSTSSTSHLVHFDLDNFVKKQRIRHKIVNTANSVTLIAACQDRHESLLMSYPSWSAVSGINQIVLVEWSDTPYNWHKIPKFVDDVQSRRLTVVLTKGVSEWSLARAYNLAAKFAIGNYVLKVDCDTHLKPDFLTKNPVPTEGEYYTVTWGAERTTNERRLMGVWFGKLADFNKVSGYDERIVSYGYEDADLYERLNKLAGLSPKVFDLDTLRHNVGAGLAIKRDQHYLVTRRVSIRANQQLLGALPKWTDISEDHSMQYYYLYDRSLKVIIANATRFAPDPLHEKSEIERDNLLDTVLRTGLHDDFELPWDILETLTRDDLHHLAHFLDTDNQPHVLVVVLEGKDTLTNMFNLVSAVHLAMTRGRPTIVVWTLPDDGRVTDATKPLFSELFDLNATNEQLKRLASSEGMLKHLAPGTSVDHIRLMSAHKWCNEGLSTCAERYDRAYGPFFEISTRVPHVYDETDPLPIKSSHHTVVHLQDKTLVGSHEVRKQALRALVPAPVVRDAQQHAFGANAKSKLAVVVSSEDEAHSIAESLKRDHSDVTDQLQQSRLLPAVGPGHLSLRSALLERKEGERFCEQTDCTVNQMAMEVANVLAVSNAEQLYPQRQGGNVAGGVDQTAWLHRHDVHMLMATDLWQLQNQ